MPRTTQIKNMVQKAVQKSGKTSKKLSNQVKTHVKAMLDNPGPARMRRIIDKLDINMRTKRIADSMDVDVVVQTVPTATADEVKIATTTEFDGHNWQRLPPVSVLLQDHEGDTRMKNPELSSQEVATEVKNVSDDILRLDISIQELFGPSSSLDSIVAGLQHDTSVAPLHPPGLNPQRASLRSPSSPVSSPVNVLATPSMASSALVNDMAALSIGSPILVSDMAALHIGSPVLVSDMAALSLASPPSVKDVAMLSTLSSVASGTTFASDAIEVDRDFSSLVTSKKRKRTDPELEDDVESTPCKRLRIRQHTASIVSLPALDNDRTVPPIVSPSPSVPTLVFDATELELAAFPDTSLKSLQPTCQGSVNRVCRKRSSHRFQPYHVSPRSRRSPSATIRSSKGAGDGVDLFEAKMERAESVSKPLVSVVTQCSLERVSGLIEAGEVQSLEATIELWGLLKASFDLNREKDQQKLLRREKTSRARSCQRSLYGAGQGERGPRSSKAGH